MWASWAVAVAFGMRVTAADRDLALDVWQRPSHGRAGDVEAVIGNQRPHRFGYVEPPPLGALMPAAGPCEFTWRAKLTATQRMAVSTVVQTVGSAYCSFVSAGKVGTAPRGRYRIGTVIGHFIWKSDDVAGVTPNPFISHHHP